MLGSCGEPSKVGTEIESIRTDLGLTLKELCTVICFCMCSMSVPCMCVCTWAPILIILFLTSQ